MNTKHTDGTWKIIVTGEANEIRDVDNNCIAYCPNYGVGSVSAGRSAPWHNAFANAELIASAPDLLRMLQKLAEYHDVRTLAELPRPELDAAMVEAREIIAKATGQG